jgi:hypothetical protein
MCNPRAIVLVHGEKGKMGFLKQRIVSELGIPTYDPANAASLDIYTDNPTRVLIETRVIETAYDEARRRMLNAWREGKGNVGPIVGEIRYSGKLLFSKNGDRIRSAGGKENLEVQEDVKPEIQTFKRPWRSTGVEQGEIGPVEVVIRAIMEKMEMHELGVTRSKDVLLVGGTTVNVGLGTLSVTWLGEESDRISDIVITLVNQVLM